jgi:hypothetical protein
MTERESFEAYETKQEMLSSYPVCCVCHEEPSTQLAHRISQGKRSGRTHSKNALHHKWNLVPVCGLKCNSAVVIDNKPRYKHILVAAIMFDLCDTRELHEEVGELRIEVLRKVGFAAKELFT